MTDLALQRPSGLAGWLASTDHKRIGLMTFVTAQVFLLVIGIFALLMRAELTYPGLQVLSEDSYNQVFTIHGSGMIYLVFTPFALALGVYLVPLQVGAAEIFAPRLTLFAFWLYVLGGLAVLAGFLTEHGAASGGWFAYPPLTSVEHMPGYGMDLWVVGVGLATAGMLIMGWTVLLTALRLRAPGMTMLRLPVFSWSLVATCLMVVTSFPVLLAALAVLEIGRRVTPLFDDPGWVIGYQHLFWFYGHPVVYVMFFPFVGAAAEVISTFARRRFVAYRTTVVSLLAFAALSMSVWAHHQFTTGQVVNEYYALTSILLLVPAGLEYFALVATMIGGSIVLTTPMLFAIGFLLQFLLGGLSGIFVASPPLDYHVHDSYFVVAHLHYVLFAGSLFALFAAIYFWFPKATGVLLRERLGKVHFALLVVGTNLAFFPMHILGYRGMTRRIADYPADAGFTTMNILSTAGAFLIAVGLALFLWNVVASLRRPRPAGNDPWGAFTLEWATSSPPPRFNFERLPPIRSYAPLLDLRERPP